MLHKQFIYRQMTRSGRQPLLFIVCVMLSIQSIVALEGFSTSVRRSLLQDAKALHAADIIIQSNAPFSGEIMSAVARLKETGKVVDTPAHEFYSMVRPETGTATLLADLKVVGPEYPFYGTVALASGAAFQATLRPGGIVVEQNLVDRLNLSIGDRLVVGERTLTILDVVISESDRPVSFLSFGPRVFVSIGDAESLDLMKPGSRVSYKLLLKVAAGENVQELAEALDRATVDGQEKVETFQTARSRIKRFFDNMFFFLSLIAIFTLVLAGFGIRSTLFAFIRDKAETIAVFKAVGGTGRDIQTNFIALVLILGFIGSVLGIASGLGLQYLLPSLLGSLLPHTISMSFSGYVILKGFLLGMPVTALFSIAPLDHLKRIRPSAVFRKENSHLSTNPKHHLSTILLFTFFSGLILLELKEIEIGLQFIGVLTGLTLFSGIGGFIFLYLLRKFHPSNPAVRQAIRGLFRPGSAPVSIIITLSVSVGIVFSLYLVEKNLDTAFIESYPQNAPNLFFIDIQPDQTEVFLQTLGTPTALHPIVRARLVSVNEEKINPTEEKKRRGDSLLRPFSLTYRDHLLDDESLMDGDTLFNRGIRELQVSVLDTVVKMKPMKIGDRLTFNIQGIPVEATVSSIRARTRESISPYFYFVFPSDSVIREAPRTFFTAIHLPKDRISATQRRIIERFPNISVIDVSQTLATFSIMAKRLVMVIRFFTVFSIGAGILIIISSILATRWERIREAVYVKILGAKSGFTLGVCAMEHLLIGLMSATLALTISQMGSYLVCRYRFEIPYHSHIPESLCLIGATLVLVMSVGIIASFPVIRQKPASFLRNENGG